MSFEENSHSLFESAIHITEERDKKSLEKVLIATISDFVDCDSLVLFRVPPGKDKKYVEIAASKLIGEVNHLFNIIPSEYGDQRVEIDEPINRCLETKGIISDKTSSTQRMLFPVTVNNTVTGIVDVYGYNNTEVLNKLITGFIRIYSNFLSIINDNEHDTLTGLLNRKTFDAQLAELLLKSVEDKSTLIAQDSERRCEKSNIFHWIGILDIDFFKKINDNFGHVYGDEVLLLFSNLLEKSFRSSDLLFRYGGEEFVVVLAPATESDAYMVFERFRKKLELFDFPQVGRITVSVGMVNINGEAHTATLLESADKALYYAKEHGRNQVSNFNELAKLGILNVREIQSDIALF